MITLGPIVIPDPAPAVRIILPVPVVAVEVRLASTAMLEDAVSVSELPLLQVTGALTVIVPAEPPDVPLLAVVTVTLLLASWVWRSVFRMFEVAEALVGE